MLLQLKVHNMYVILIDWVTKWQGVFVWKWL